MRLLIIGSLAGQIGAATKIAMERGAKVTLAADIEKALNDLRNGRGADLIMADVGLDIGALVRALGLRHRHRCAPRRGCDPRRRQGIPALAARS
jgi:hypothetical protein